MYAANNPPRRPYEGTRRREKAAQARAKVARVALELIVERGYSEASMEQIAERAGVGLRTIYAYFGSKRGILDGLLESFAAIPRGDFEARAEALADDPRAQLRLAVDFVADYFAEARPLLDLFATAAPADTAFSSLQAQGEQLRRASQKPLVANWARRQALRPGLTAATAADILWTLTSPWLFRDLVHERRWSRRKYREWLYESLAELLLRRAHDGR